MTAISRAVCIIAILGVSAPNSSDKIDISVMPPGVEDKRAVIRSSFVSLYSKKAMINVKKTIPIIITNMGTINSSKDETISLSMPIPIKIPESIC